MSIRNSAHCRVVIFGAMLILTVDCSQRRDDFGRRFTVSIALPGVGTVAGTVRAPVLLVEFGSYQCPACARFATEIAPRLLDTAITAGHLRYRYIDVADTLHPNLPLALGACMARRMPVHLARRWLFAQEERPMPGTLDSLISLAAVAAGFETGELKSCVMSTNPGDRRDEFRTVSGLNVRSTPTFLVGFETSEGSVWGWPVVGIADIDSLQRYIQDATKYAGRIRVRATPP